MLVRDAEVLTNAFKVSLQAFEFNPGVPGLTRLARYEEMYSRFRIRSVRVEFMPGTGVASAGNVTFGVAVGPKNPRVTADNLTALSPVCFTPAWKSASLVVDSQIDNTRWGLCGGGTESISFTLYTVASAESLGLLRIHYSIEFAFPHPL